MQVACIYQTNRRIIFAQTLTRTNLIIIQHSHKKEKLLSKSVITYKQKGLFFCAQASKLHTSIDTNHPKIELYV